MELNYTDYQRLAAYIMAAKLGIPPKQIARILDMSPSWVYDWKKNFSDYYVQDRVDPCLEEASEYLIEAEDDD